MESTQAFGHGLDDVNTPYNRPLKCRLLPRSPDGFEEINSMGCHSECVTRICVAHNWIYLNESSLNESLLNESLHTQIFIFLYTNKRTNSYICLFFILYVYFSTGAVINMLLAQRQGEKR